MKLKTRPHFQFNDKLRIGSLYIRNILQQSIKKPSHGYLPPEGEGEELFMKVKIRVKLKIDGICRTNSVES